MPHKHTRRERDLSTFDLPPTQIARPLPTASARKPARKSTPNQAAKATKSLEKGDAAKGIKRKRDGKATPGKANDAPRAFRRLMALAAGKRTRPGLDDGRPTSKKAKKAKTGEADATTATRAGGTDATDGGTAATTTATTTTTTTTADATRPVIPTIRPGERLSEFAARVDAALPLSGLIHKGAQGGKDPLGIAKVYRTKQERKLHKLYDQWRLEDAKIKERQAEAEELEEERAMELDESLGVKWRLDFERAKGGKAKKKRKQGDGGNNNDDDDDMWAEFNRRKLATTASTVRAGIHGVAKAPPELTKVNGSKFKFAQKAQKAKEELAAADAAETTTPVAKAASHAVVDIPKAAGSLAERVQLQAVRADVLASYHKHADRRRQKAAAAAASEVETEDAGES